MFHSRWFRQLTPLTLRTLFPALTVDASSPHWCYWHEQFFQFKVIKSLECLKTCLEQSLELCMGSKGPLRLRWRRTQSAPERDFFWCLCYVYLARFPWIMIKLLARRQAKSWKVEDLLFQEALSPHSWEFQVHILAPLVIFITRFCGEKESSSLEGFARKMVTVFPNFPIESDPPSSSPDLLLGKEVSK